MKKKQGCTLIELLAVIVILSIIALIAIPVIYDTIDKSKMGAFEQTLVNISKGAKLYKAKVELDDEFTECRYFSFSDDVKEVTKKDGKTYYPLKDLNSKGALPIEGEVKVCDDTVVVNAGNGSYSGRYEDGETTVVKGELADNDLQPPVIDIFNVTPKRNAIVVVVSAHSQKQDGIIANYYYKIDDGDYIKTTEQSYVFEGLEPKTEYTITVMVENSYGIKTKMFKQVTTVNFGELTIDVEKPNEWTSSKNVTIKETSDEYKTEYKIRKYNEETKEIEESEFLEYTDSFTLDTMATNDYPILIIARYNDNGTYSDEKTYTVVNIDTTSPTNIKPVVNVSTTKPTSEASVVIRQDDSESGLDESTIEYGYSLDNVDYTWQASFELKKLKAGTKYYVKTRVTNNVGKTVESEATEYTPGEITTCSVSVPSGWSTSKAVTISGTQTGVELQYQVGSTNENNWTTISSGGTVKVEENTSVYCRLWDGTTAGGTGTGIVEGIDKTGPSNIAPTVVQSESDARALVVTNNQNDLESNLDLNTLLYGYSTDNVTYTWQASNTFGSLVAGTTYYFKTKVSNNAGMEVISNYTTGKIAYTGIAAGTYSAGTTVNYAGVDWLVMSDNGDNVTLITKSNIETGVYNTTASSDYSTSKAKTTVDNWFNDNSVLVSDKNIEALIADSSTGYYVRLPRSNELSTNIPNSSETPFWTMSEYSSYQVVGALKNGISIYYFASGSLYTRDSISTKGEDPLVYENSSKTEYVQIPASYNLIRLNVSSITSSSVDKYYSSNKESYDLYKYANICDATFGVTGWTVSKAGTYPVGDSTCKKYNTVYRNILEDVGPLGYRPVITVKEK